MLSRHCGRFACCPRGDALMPVPVGTNLTWSPRGHPVLHLSPRGQSGFAPPERPPLRLLSPWGQLWRNRWTLISDGQEFTLNLHSRQKLLLFNKAFAEIVDLPVSSAPRRLAAKGVRFGLSPATHPESGSDNGGHILGLLHILGDIFGKIGDSLSVPLYQTTDIFIRKWVWVWSQNGPRLDRIEKPDANGTGSGKSVAFSVRSPHALLGKDATGRKSPHTRGTAHRRQETRGQGHACHESGRAQRRRDEIRPAHRHGSLCAGRRTRAASVWSCG